MVRGVFEHVPASVGGHLQRLPTRLTFGITGPFNGQRRRTAAVAAMFKAINFGTVIETGHVPRARRVTCGRDGRPIATVEVSPSYYRYSQRRLRKLPKVSQFLGHSPAVLEQLRVDRRGTRSRSSSILDALVERSAAARQAGVDSSRLDGVRGSSMTSASTATMATSTTTTDRARRWSAAPGRRSPGPGRPARLLALCAGHDGDGARRRHGSCCFPGRGRRRCARLRAA
jgi:hypothetical protein